MLVACATWLPTKNQWGREKVWSKRHVEYREPESASSSQQSVVLMNEFSPTAGCLLTPNGLRMIVLHFRETSQGCIHHNFQLFSRPRARYTVPQTVVG